MKKIPMSLGNRSYSIIIEDGLINSLAMLLKKKNTNQQWIIISQQSIMKHYGNDLYNQLNDNGFNVKKIMIDEGESSKDIKIYMQIVSKLLESNCDRSSIILALGGGVVGDIAGFVASTYLRGIKYYQIPTTLLAMVDSSIGGKTGLNYLRTKNIIGTIYQPDAVLIDPQLLSTLPVDETISGIGEIIKYGAIKDSIFLKNLNEWIDDLNNFPYSIAIERCCEIKADVVSADEKEKDLRRILNFGHTIGHALESHIGYDNIRHGEAISYGMKCASWISKEKSLINNDEYNFMIELINKLPLPKLDKLNYDQIIQFINFDKKYQNGKLSFILLNGLGSTEIATDISKELIRKSLKVLQ
ncbi:MAG: 3-dehydroquinate synthase [Candidatus Neomarinimicrobiota bacterium]|jgi:3-dehydroquinate synthase|nr:3-dehydroquinate synthase [Candidatus Neomarinimicrobiota bacterium]MEE3302242.1 3-dehydroquinate synthase [Candidatus Neomarinimicrobiota bacterium]|tara:strand:+ start:718 stop:1788 length:1071 start_codon:yes stop_codon:yes gene_type:complete